MATTTTAAATPTPKDISWHHKDSKFLGVGDIYDLYGGGGAAGASMSAGIHGPSAWMLGNDGF